MDQSEVTVETPISNKVVASKTPLHKCPKCDRTFANIGHMKCHFYRVHPEFRLASCEVVTVPPIQKLKQKSPEPEPPAPEKKLLLSEIEQFLFKCEKCSRCFTKKSSLLKHCVSVHTDVRPFHCEVCDKSFHTEYRLKVHQETHEKKKPCFECIKEPYKNQERCAHSRKEKSFTCDVCNQSFSYRSSLKTHHRVHTNERPYQCDICEKDFGRKSSLKLHKLSHTLQKPFQCDVCQKDFRHPNSLRVHQRTHSNKRPFQCEVCNQNFYRKDLLKEHYRIHTNEKPFVCEVCNATFTQRRYLSAHCLSHTEDKYYECHLCDKRFTRKCSLARHAVSHKLD